MHTIFMLPIRLSEYQTIKVCTLIFLQFFFEKFTPLDFASVLLQFVVIVLVNVSAN